MTTPAPAPGNAAPTPPAPAAGSPPASGSWRDSLPEDIRGHESLATFEDVGSLAKSYVGQQRLIGADKLVKPTKDSTPEEIDAFYAALGRPAKAEEYKLPEQDMPEGWKPDEARVAHIRAEAHRLGITAQQFAGLVRADATFAHQQHGELTKAAEHQRDANIAALRKDWGPAFDERLSLAKNAVREFGGDELIAELEQSGLGNHPRLIQAFAKIGKVIASDEVIGGGGNRRFVLTPAEANAEIGKLYGDAEFQKAYMTAHHPGHAAAVEKMRTLMQLAHPEEPAA